ncbi:hypothetical protein CEXT_583911 [Caerostris extrusa]|uniref:Uncharacterized protein n=1 Tax=Caerostris extrusa TaxID=172846 RepID=A0AAV4RZV9_CAEEX|nr:hypothetical protein CEXT_583911 [Caerostris extrusa]
MNEELAYSSAVEVIAKYRRLLSWWTFVRVTPRIMYSNIDVIYELSEVNNIPVDRIRKEMRKMKKIAKLSINLCIDIQRILKEIMSFIYMLIAEVSIYSSEESNSVAFAYKKFIENSTGRQPPIKWDWIIPTFIFYYHGLGVGFEYVEDHLEMHARGFLLFAKEMIKSEDLEFPLLK